MWNITFPKKIAFSKNSTSSENVFVLNSFSTKKVSVPKSNCPKQLSFLKRWLLSRVPQKSSTSGEIEAPKKLLLCRNSYTAEV